MSEQNLDNQVSITKTNKLFNMKAGVHISKNLENVNNYIVDEVKKILLIF
jgi:hypothetical protein